MSSRKAIIIGAGPAGLTAAYELLTRTAIRPLVLEKSGYMGGISRTHCYKGNRIDLGGHRFFSKSDRVMQWWLDRLPLESMAASRERIEYQGCSRYLDAAVQGPDPEREDRVMLLRRRRSRIYFLRKFFQYPIQFNLRTLRNMGVVRLVRIGLSYLRWALFPPRKIGNLEEFLISRFGKELYLTFFKSYTEKVWGVPCHEISAEWGAQRIKGLSITRTLVHFVKQIFGGSGGIAQKDVETSLIEQFLYPKHGPGQMWEEVAAQVRSLGGEIRTNMEAVRILVEGNRVVAVEAKGKDGSTEVFDADLAFSTMPIQELVRKLATSVPEPVRRVSEGLVYRDFITVGLLLDKLKVTEPGAAVNALIRDNWIYIQEPDVLVGRLQIFNNWSPYLVADRSKVWIGAEYFCNEGDELWRKPDEEIIELAAFELDKIGIVNKSDVVDATVLRMEKTYPAYFGSYGQFPVLSEYLDGFENLYLLGRNGMHRYNNQDHSMLAAMVAVDNIAAGRADKSNIWAVNAEQEYHETR